MKSQGAFRILCDAYVTDDSGTGVVHQAPYFGAVSLFDVEIFRNQSRDHF